MLIIIIFLMCPLYLFGQETKPIVDAWEPSDTILYKSEIPQPQSIFLDAANFLISFYKKDISGASVSRCPFAISCSSFCREAITKYGFGGLILFVDRYFYRENMEAFLHYRLTQINYGVLKLDDELFLFPN